jgi:hypothetical protein
MDDLPIHKLNAVIGKIVSLHLALALRPPADEVLESSDFFIFGYLTVKMVGIDFASPQELIGWIRSTFEAIPRHVLDEIFKS